jgi:hypothetical protein
LDITKNGWIVQIGAGREKALGEVRITVRYRHTVEELRAFVVEDLPFHVVLGLDWIGETRAVVCCGKTGLPAIYFGLDWLKAKSTDGRDTDERTKDTSFGTPKDEAKQTATHPERMEDRRSIVESKHEPVVTQGEMAEEVAQGRLEENVADLIEASKEIAVEPCPVPERLEETVETIEYGSRKNPDGAPQEIRTGRVLAVTVEPSETEKPLEAEPLIKRRLMQVPRVGSRLIAVRRKYEYHERDQMFHSRTDVDCQRNSREADYVAVPRLWKRRKKQRQGETLSRLC